MNFAESLDATVHPKLQRVVSDLRDELVAWSQSYIGETVEIQEQPAFLTMTWMQQQFEIIAELHKIATVFSARMLNSTNELERHAAILDFAEQMGADRLRLKSDKKALHRFLDNDAILERYRCRVGERERALIYGFEQAGDILGTAFAQRRLSVTTALLPDRFAPLLKLAREYRGDARVRQSALCALHKITINAPVRLSGFWVDEALRETQRVALNTEENAWAQCDALSILWALSPAGFGAVIARRLSPDADNSSVLARDNRIFVRGRLAHLLVSAVHSQPKLTPWLQRLANDTNGAVRQAMALAIPKLPAELFMPLYAKLRVDRDPQVRAALFANPAAMAEAAGGEPFLKHLERVFRLENNEFVLRIAMTAAEGYAHWQSMHNATGLADVIDRLRIALADLRAREVPARIIRWAGVTRERLWLLNDTQAQGIAADIQTALTGLREGQRRAIKRLRDPVTTSPDLVGRVLSVLAEYDFGFELDLARAPRLRRGDRFKRRLWRILYEWRHGSTDKRQAWLHTIGRSYTGPILAPPAHMAELAPTKVPGEPLHHGDEAGWRNYVPLLDHILSVTDRGGRMQLYTSEGITTLVAPRGLWRRMRAFMAISWRFSELATLRNQSGNEYIQALRRHGVDITHAPYSEETVSHPRIARFFELGSAVVIITQFWNDVVAYVSTVYQNSLPQLAVFIGLASAWFMARHIWLGQRMRRMRGRIGLVLGGWGTRGKSGTERLKAGLINALGHPLVSKTTGCEAMFLHGTACGDLKEMFLFRPYDKATIWEQFDLVRVSLGLNAKVFLWECMGLTPSYVRVLQKDWMRDDIATITNTYPDHEDVQGPAGRNIPEVMTEFIPEKSLLLTTEEEMLPILREGAEKYDSRIRPVGWKEAGLIHQDFLDRFPYAEHPYNIALVTAMADEMGLAPDFAVKEMADRVVADLGVLKIYPQSQINGRTLEFVMGNSANERFGAMGNWTRMGFAAHDMGKDPQIFVSTLVNNRADRVPRSRVFARMLVEDVAADCHMLIGSNIDGLLGFIEESWAEYAPKISLVSEDHDPLSMLIQHAKHQRIPINNEELDGRLRAMLTPFADQLSVQDALKAAALGQLATTLAGIEQAADIIAHYDLKKSQMEGYQALATKVSAGVAAGGDMSAHEGDLRNFLRSCFMAKLVPVREYYTPGEDIVRLIARHTPPGLINRIMGMQNIKGTGLDFVYRWQAWESCYKACQQLLDKDHGTARRGLDFLMSFQEYGILSAAYVTDIIQTLKDDIASGVASFSDLGMIEAKLSEQMATLNAAGSQAGGKGGGKLIGFFEALLDAGDAVRRRKAAERIYRDMIAQQISSPKAAYELKKLTTRQKGGWLSAAIEHKLSFFRGRK